MVPVLLCSAGADYDHILLARTCMGGIKIENKVNTTITTAHPLQKEIWKFGIWVVWTRQTKVRSTPPPENMGIQDLGSFELRITLELGLRGDHLEPESERLVPPFFFFFSFLFLFFFFFFFFFAACFWTASRQSFVF